MLPVRMLVWDMPFGEKGEKSGVSSQLVATNFRPVCPGSVGISRGKVREHGHCRRRRMIDDIQLWEVIRNLNDMHLLGGDQIDIGIS